MVDSPSGQPSGGDNNPAPPAKSIEQQLADLTTAQTRIQSDLQASREELKRVNNLNGVLLQRLNVPGGGAPGTSDGRGMDVSRTVPVKLKRDFSKMDPTADPAAFASELVLEVAEHTAATIQQQTAMQAEAQRFRASFYEKNRDLVGHEVEVGHFSGQVQAENPNLPFDQAAEIIAQRTRDYVKQKYGNPPTPPNGDLPPNPLPPSNGPAGNNVPIKAPKGAGDEPFNADKTYADDMKDELAMRSKERSKTLGT